MASRAQIIRLEQRIDALLVTGSKSPIIIVVDPSETSEEALERAGILPAAASRVVLIHTGVPRSW
jgi:hypothetical protein